MKDIKYRTADINDLTAIKGVSLNAYGQYKSLLSPENIIAWEANLSNDKTYLDLLNSGTCFVAINDETIVGTAFLIPHGNPFKWFEFNWSYIRLVGVLPDFEGRGIGKTLTEMCIALAKETGEETIALHTSEFQNAARHIYESLGFKRHKEFELFEKKYWLYLLSI